MVVFPEIGMATEIVPHVLVLEGKLGIKEAAGLKKRLAVVLEADGPITINAARVENADTAALQLLAAFVNAARSQSRLPTWKKVSEAFQEVAILLDLDQHLGLETALAGDPDGDYDDE